MPDALSVLCAYNVPALANGCRLPSPGFHDLECSSFAQRRSENVARFVLHEMEKCKGVETELIGILGLDFPNSDAAEALKHEGFSETVARADGLVLVVPEYNHGYPGLLKHVLRFESEGIHPQGGRRARRLCGRVGRPASDREPAAGAEKAGSGDNLLGRQFLRSARAFRWSGKDPGQRLCQAHR